MFDIQVSDVAGRKRYIVRQFQRQALARVNCWRTIKPKQAITRFLEKAIAVRICKNADGGR
jgi:hypothetical protein